MVTRIFVPANRGGAGVVEERANFWGGLGRVGGGALDGIVGFISSMATLIENRENEENNRLDLNKEAEVVDWVDDGGEEEDAQIELAIWNPKHGCEVNVIGNKTFFFQFHHWKDKKSVMDAQPWHFDHHVMVLDDVKGYGEKDCEENVIRRNFNEKLRVTTPWKATKNESYNEEGDLSNAVRKLFITKNSQRNNNDSGKQDIEMRQNENQRQGSYDVAGGEISMPSWNPDNRGDGGKEVLRKEQAVGKEGRERDVSNFDASENDHSSCGNKISNLSLMRLVFFSSLFLVRLHAKAVAQTTDDQVPCSTDVRRRPHGRRVDASCLHESTVVCKYKMAGVTGTLTNTALQHSFKQFTLSKLRQLHQHRKLHFHLNFANFSTTQFNSHKTHSANVDNLIVLGIETSCDDTAAAVVRGNGEILSQVVSTQADLLVQYGGVAPKMAEEAHSRAIDWVTQAALDKANLTAKDLSAVAVTIGPGLSLCLRGFYILSGPGPWLCSSDFFVGVCKGREIARSFQLPIIGVHHMEAHTLVARLTDRDLQFPFMALLISGGHNLLILAHGLGHYIQLGTTIDDAIGEAYDKTAKWLGLDMRRSSGPAIEDLAREGDPDSIRFKSMSSPLMDFKCDCVRFLHLVAKGPVEVYVGPMENWKFTAISQLLDAEIPLSLASSHERSSRADIAASFQRVAVLHLEERCERAIEWALKMEPSIKCFVVSGGVASNQYVRARLDQIAKNKGLQLVCPPPSLCTDNGVMVAWTGIEHFQMGRFDTPPPADEPEDTVYDLRPRWPLGEEYADGKSEARSMRKARMHPSLTSLIQGSAKQLL
uniref:Glycoprotease 1 n=1 Tax=Chenopodium quinoa TaxID=63459 RepID=A0A803MA42_CHEQI